MQASVTPELLSGRRARGASVLPLFSSMNVRIGVPLPLLNEEEK